MVFTSIADFIINPKGEQMDNKNIFRPEIAIKMRDFALIMSYTMGICGILSQLLMFPIDHIITTDETEKKNDNNTNNDKKQEKETDISNEIYSKEDSENKTKEEIIEGNEKTGVNEPFMQAFKSWRFHLFNFISVGTLCNLIFYLILKIFFL